MNNIVEIVYPNLDNYFKDLLELQEKQYEDEKEQWKSYFKKFYSKVIPFITNIIFLQILNSLSALDLPNAAKLILVIGVSIATISSFITGFHFIVSLALFFIFSSSILNQITSYKSYNEQKTLSKIKDDFGKQLNKSYFEINSKGFITDLKRNDKVLCQELEEHLKTNKKEVI